MGVLAQAGGEMPARSRGAWRLWVPAAALLVVAVLGAGLLWTVTRDASEGIPLTATVPASEGGGEISGEMEEGNLQHRAGGVGPARTPRGRIL